MNDFPDNASRLSPNKLALLKIRELKQRLAAAESSTAGDIAIVSMACRFPRTNDTPEKFWDCLLRAENQISEIPTDRWDLEAFYDENPEIPGKMYARRGVFLENLAWMDPEFFGISPREATWVDPQQRMLLEVGWEALERAGWAADRIGRQVGVFVGWMHNDYQNEASDSFLNLNPYIATGAAGSFLSGRLAYYLGLEGPSLATDTACSSSLVALHLACQSLLQNECDRAVVGGVNAIVSPTTNILTCKLNALSPSGQSLAFDARADGYVRGEGCGVVTLRRLVDAQEAGDPILGIIRGSAVGHNGSGSGLTVPNARSQQQVIQRALQRARIEPTEVAYLEAHGTGTELGDPIEIQAAAAALARNRAEQNRLLVGSVKTNVGHLEAAAGMAGLIKTLLAFENDLIPPQLGFEQPNPHIPWEQLPLEIVTRPTEWPAGERRLAGVSAFGMSGTNAHVVLEAPPKSSTRFLPGKVHLDSRARAAAPADTGSQDADDWNVPRLFVLSGHTPDGLRDLAALYHRWLSDNQAAKGRDVACTLAEGRKHWEHRAAVVAESRTDLEQAFGQLHRGGRSKYLHQGHARQQPKLAWQFTGQGAQYVGMARDLYESQTAFRHALDECDELLRQLRGASLIEVMFEHSEQLNHTSWTQPALFSVQRGLAQLLQTWGIAPDLVFGHSVGQYAAACVAGILDWEDGLRLISERGRLIGELPAGGVMLAVFASLETVERQLGDFPQLSLAAVNGSHVVVSGAADPMEQLADQFTQQGIRCKRLTTSHAFHSALMEPALQPFRQLADRVTCKPPRIPLVCNITGQLLPHDQAVDGGYWSRHIRAPVQYARSVASAQEFGCTVLLELGPQAILTNMAASVWSGEQSRLISCLQADGRDATDLLSAIAQLYSVGINPEISQLESIRGGKRILLPTYPFQRRRFWGPAKPKAAQAAHHSQHPLLGGQCRLAGLPRETRFENFIQPDNPDWLSDHEVMGEIVFPGAAFVEMAVAAAGASRLRDIRFEQPLRPTARTAMQTVVCRDGDSRKLEIYSGSVDAAGWSRHMTAALDSEPDHAPDKIDRNEIFARLEKSAEPDSFYRTMREMGLNYGSQFQTIKALHYSQREVLSHLQTNKDLRGFVIPPTLLDGALHSLAVGLLEDASGALFLPVGLEQMECFASAGTELWCHAVWKQPEGDLRTADLTLFDDRGSVVAGISGLQLRRLDRAALRRIGGSRAQQLSYELRWKRLRLPPGRTDKHDWLVVGSGDALQREAAGLLTEDGHRVASVLLPNAATGQEDQADFHLPSGDDPPWNRLLDEVADSFSSFSLEGVVWLLADRPVKAAGLCGKEAGVQAAASPVQDLADELPAIESDSQMHINALIGLVATLRQRGITRLECGLQLITRGAMSPADLSHNDPYSRASEATSGEAENPDELNSGNELADPVQTQFWGLGRVLGAEHPEFRCRMIDLGHPKLGVTQTADAEAARGNATADRQGPAEWRQMLTELVLNDTTESQVVIQDGQYWIPRLMPIPVQAASAEAASATEDETIPLVRPRASYLITGGLGMLGRQAARWLAEQGAEQVVLVSRRSPDRSTVESLKELERGGCAIEIVSADFSQRTEVERLLARFGADLPELRGVIHAAGVLDDGLLVDQSWDRFRTVMAPKINGALWLDEFTRSHALDFLVFYSSAASVLGSPGQSNYATANAFLDGLAWRRRGAGLPALSVNWGPWTEGMADDEQLVKRLALQGITPLSVTEAHEQLERMLRTGAVQTTVIDADWRRMRMGMGSQIPSLLTELIPSGSEPSRPAKSELLNKLAATSGAERRKLLLASIQADVQEVLSTSGPPEVDRPLIEMGLDSLMAVEFGTRLQQRLGDQFAISPTMLFDHPTIDAISDYVLELLSEDQPSEQKSTPEARMPEAVANTVDEVAIIGMSCRFPGASNVQEYWENLLQGVDSVSEIPGDRWDVDRFYDPSGQAGKMVSREGGFLDDVAGFDAAFFNISDAEACWMDPQHRLLLENSWTALEDAGWTVDKLKDKNVGVFMGIMSSDYAFLPSLEDASLVSAFQGAGFSHSAGVGRISHLFGFEGPCLAIDSASSSSLVAVCQAMRSLQDGHCNLALAGGVNAILVPGNSLLMSKAGLLSPDGRCKSFSAEADGFGRGEGCGVIVMKRLRDAQRDGDRILAVLRGGAISHNGVSGSITTPSSRAQARLIADALRNAKIAPREVQYLEAHGTGTELGDPMEIGAALSVLGKGRRKDQALLVGSVKANISHLEAAGGISGLIKTVLALHHGVIPPQIHFAHPSPHIPWQRLPVEVVTQTKQWPQAGRRTAGVTALGLSGTNAHVLLSSVESPPDNDSTELVAERPRHLLVLSGRDQKAVLKLAERFRDHLRNDKTTEIADICYTAAVGRDHFEHRAAFLVSTVSEAAKLLSQLDEDNGFSERPAGEKTEDQAQPQTHRCVWTGHSSGSPQIGWLFGDRMSPRGRAVHGLYREHPRFRAIILRQEEVWQDALSDAAARTRVRPAPALDAIQEVSWSSWLAGEAKSTASPGPLSPEPSSPESCLESSVGGLIEDVRAFLLQSAISELWGEWGIDPDAVLGFGSGHYAAVCTAGGMAFADALRLLLERAVVRSQLDLLQAESVDAELVSDAEQAVLDQFEELADTINFYPPNRPLICSLTGELVPAHRSLAGKHWREHCVASCEFEASLRALAEQGCDFVMDMGCQLPTEMGIDPAKYLGASQRISSLGAGKPVETETETAIESMLGGLARLYVAGGCPDFIGFDAAWKRRKVSLPTYPFRRKRYWITDLSQRVESSS